MLDRLVGSEIMYVSNFSKSLEDENIIRFWDDALPDMYMHNFTLIKNDANIDELKEVILEEIDRRKKNSKSFLRIEANFPLDIGGIDLPINPNVTIYNYMSIQTNRCDLLKGNDNCMVREALSSEVLNDGIEVDLLANEPFMGRDFAERRINRKSEVYKRPNAQLSLYVCYHNDLPIGNCELMIHNQIAKIEDFDILQKYQRKGFGTSILKHLLQRSREANVDIAYLITDSADTAKEMYKKCGFRKVGEKTELFFDFREPESVSNQ